VAANALRLEHAELDALRALQAGAGVPDVDDPVWDELVALQIVVRGAGRPRMELPMRGRLYTTDE
jgi:hypothetical protein